MGRGASDVIAVLTPLTRVLPLGPWPGRGIPPMRDACRRGVDRDLPPRGHARRG